MTPSAGAAPAPLDAELHLRLAGEHALREPGNGPQLPFDLRVRDTAEALVAVGALDRATAEAVVDAYDDALALRGRPTVTAHTRALPPPAAPRRAVVPRIALGTGPLKPAWGRLDVHYVILGDDATVMVVTAHEDVPGRLLANGTPQPPLTDDRGTTTVATVAPGPSPGGGYSATLVAAPPLHRDTAWIDVGPNRLDLVDPAPVTATVTVEDLPAATAARRHLRDRVADTLAPLGPVSDLATTVDTLVAVGALDPDDDAIAEAAQVAARGPRLHGTAPPPPREPLGEPWRSLFAGRGRSDGTAGAVALRAEIPDLDGDGSAARLYGLVTYADGFSLLGDVRGRGGAAVQPFLSPALQRGWTWWADDDAGGHYLGTALRGSPSVGSLRFFPPLDPRATVLRLCPTGLRRRAVVSVPVAPRAGGPA
jgi:hypothetical protein